VGRQIEGHRLENIGVHGGIILKFILKKQEMVVRTGFFRLRIRKKWQTKVRGISQLAVKVLATRERLCSVELFIKQK